MDKHESSKETKLFPITIRSLYVTTYLEVTLIVLTTHVIINNMKI